MEGATISLALLLMAGALSLSIGIRAQSASGIETLQQQIALRTKIHSAFDATILSFWRYYGTRDNHLLAVFHSNAQNLQSLTRSLADTTSSEAQRAEAAQLQQTESELLGLMNQLAVGPQISKNDKAQSNEIVDRDLQMQDVFRKTQQKQFQNLHSSMRELGRYTDGLLVLLVILGGFPLLVMLWFQRAHRERIWEPLEQLHGMVMEVKRGNLDVKGEVPETLELGSLTSAFLSMASDLRETRNSLEQRVSQRAAQLEAAQQDLLRAAKLASLGQLVSGVAHEINNPLTSILGFSEVVLGRAGLEPSVRNHVQTVRNEALRLKHLVANLSRMSRRSPERLHRLDLRTIPDRMLELRGYQLAANNVHMLYARPPEPIWVKGDTDLLLQVLLQLILNAEQSIRECREKGEIRLQCEVWEGRARITIQDNGGGMSSEMREHAFDPFFTTRPSGQGTGLGLSICHSIVEQHSGEIRLETEAGRGTTIRVLLPLAIAAEAEASGENQAKNADRPAFLPPPNALRAAEFPANAKGALRVLVIDDETEILNLVSLVLAEIGASVVALQDSTRLNAALSQATFDAVLCDLKMPGEDGLAVLRTLRKKRPELAQKFLLMTGNLADADKARTELDGVPILPKPFTPAQLQTALAEIAFAKF